LKGNDDIVYKEETTNCVFRLHIIT